MTRAADPRSTGPTPCGELVDEHFPAAERIVLVLDNLNTHDPGRALRRLPPGRGQADLGQAGGPLHPQARQLAEHRRDRVERAGAGSACTAASPTRRRWPPRSPPGWPSATPPAVRVDWHFTTADARTKLNHLYPVPQPDTERWSDY